MYSSHATLQLSGIDQREEACKGGAGEPKTTKQMCVYYAVHLFTRYMHGPGHSPPSRWLLLRGVEEESITQAAAPHATDADPCPRSRACTGAAFSVLVWLPLLVS